MILCGGARPQLPAPFSEGAFYLPTIIAGLPPTARCAREEIFGPVITVHKFESELEVVAYANNTKYGLSFSSINHHDYHAYLAPLTAQLSLV